MSNGRLQRPALRAAAEPQRWASRGAVNKLEARAVLQAALREYRSRPYSELVKLLDKEINTEAQGDSGVTYQIEIQVFWDDRPDGTLRVLGSIDDGGWRAFIPVTEAFLLAPDGSFVDE